MNTPEVQPIGVTCWGCLACAACVAGYLTLVSALSGVNTAE